MHTTTTKMAAKLCKLLILGCILAQTLMALPTKKDVDVGACKDVRKDCMDKKYFCEYYPNYMYNYCRSFCGFCHMSKDDFLGVHFNHKNIPQTLKKRIGDIWDNTRQQGKHTM